MCLYTFTHIYVLLTFEKIRKIAPIKIIAHKYINISFLEILRKIFLKYSKLFNNQIHIKYFII